MAIGDFIPKGNKWFQTVPEDKNIIILFPKNGKIFFTAKGASKKDIAVFGKIAGVQNGKVLLIIKTDKEYPVALGKINEDGSFTFSGCELGGVDHIIFAVLFNQKEQPIARSKAITVRLERG